MFPNDFRTIIRVGGSAIYSEEYYKCLQLCMEAAGDQYFVVVEDHADEHDRSSVYTTCPDEWQAFHFKYPVTVSYQQIMSGKYLSEEVMLMGSRDYFLYGDSGKWGIYAGDDVLYSLHIVGFQSNLSDVFTRHISSDEKDKRMPRWLNQALETINRCKRNNPDSF